MKTLPLIEQVEEKGKASEDNKIQRIHPDSIVKQIVDDSHYYFINDVFYPSVTAILDEAAPMGYGLRRYLINNTQEQIDETLSVTGALGSKLHDAYELLLNGKELDLVNDYPTIKEKKHLVSFYDWYNTYKPTEIQAESVVASSQFRYAGTLDLCCKIGGKRIIVDFKTGSAIHYSHGLQVSAYKYAYEEMYQKNVDEVWILRTGSRHGAGYEFKQMKVEFASFLNVYNTYKDLHNGRIPEPPMITSYPKSIKLPKIKPIVIPDNQISVDDFEKELLSK